MLKSDQGWLHVSASFEAIICFRLEKTSFHHIHCTILEEALCAKRLNLTGLMDTNWEFYSCNEFKHNLFEFIELFKYI
jgi:hypothetical protein